MCVCVCVMKKMGDNVRYPSLTSEESRIAAAVSRGRWRIMKMTWVSFGFFALCPECSMNGFLRRRPVLLTLLYFLLPPMPTSVTCPVSTAHPSRPVSNTPIFHHILFLLSARQGGAQGEILPCSSVIHAVH